jgi:hypothetical protein
MKSMEKRRMILHNTGLSLKVHFNLSMKTEREKKAMIYKYII